MMDTLFEMPPSDPNAMVILHGRGPKGKKCGTCGFLIARRYSRTYYKCEMRGVTSSAATDHRVRWNACRFYVEAVSSTVKRI